MTRIPVTRAVGREGRAQRISRPLSALPRSPDSHTKRTERTSGATGRHLREGLEGGRVGPFPLCGSTWDEREDRSSRTDPEPLRSSRAGETRELVSAASAGRPPRLEPHNHAGLEADAESETSASARRPHRVRRRPHRQKTGLEAGQEGTAMKRTAHLLTRADVGLRSEVVQLATNHPASSYGLPVVLRHGVALGPAELPGVLVVDDPTEAGRAEAAGYRVALDFAEAEALLDGGQE